MPQAIQKPKLEEDLLRALKRSELQALAKVRSILRMVIISNRLRTLPQKTYGVKANGKNEIIIKSLLSNKAFVDSRDESIAKSSKDPASTQLSPKATKARKCIHLLLLYFLI
jgi:hypothetical protein